MRIFITNVALFFLHVLRHWVHQPSKNRRPMLQWVLFNRDILVRRHRLLLVFLQANSRTLLAYVEPCSNDKWAAAGSMDSDIGSSVQSDSTFSL